MGVILHTCRAAFDELPLASVTIEYKMRKKNTPSLKNPNMSANLILLSGGQQVECSFQAPLPLTGSPFTASTCGAHVTIIFLRPEVFEGICVYFGMKIVKP